MKVVHKLLSVILFSLFSFNFCSCTEVYHWQKSVDGNLYLWTTEAKSFTWDGDIKGNFPNGKGTVQYYDNGKKSNKENLNLIFGAEEKQYKILGSSQNKYVGNFIKNGSVKTPDGIGVLIKSNGQIYAGNFSYGQLTKAYHFINDLLQYYGDFENNHYSGYGEYYNNNKLLYAGYWENGIQSGKGTEFQDGAKFSGEYLKGKKEGPFEISRNGTIRLVNFHEGKPDLNNCKIYFNNGTMWLGSLNSIYEPNGTGQTISSDGLINFENRVDGNLTGTQTYSFPDGSSYEGEVKDGKRNGYGVQVYSTGITYYGNWENDYQNGYGDLEIDDDWYYSGEWKNGLYDGEGYFSFPDFSYEGEWKAGKKDGYGTLTLANLQYEGFWKNDAINGKGYISYSDGSYYEGSWKDNKRNGYGEYVWADGSSYYGNWEDDFPNGEGEINLSNGDYYTGEIEYGYFSGAGTYIFANGERYEGTFVENKKDGIGYYYFSNGNSYEGEFKNNQPNGKGRFYFENGTFYDGEFENGKLKGNGSLFIPEENDYTVITSSYWSENTIPSSGSVLFANGDEFVGTLRNGMPTEYGSWTTREERLKRFSTSQKLREFYKIHQQTIEKAFQITEWVITGINAAATIVEFIRCPQVQGVAKAVDKVCDVASVVVSGTNIVIKTAVFNYDKNEIKQRGGSSEEISALKKQYVKDISGDVLNITATVGFASFQMIRAGSKAKKALEIYPNLIEATKTIEKTGELAKVAKSGKFSDKLVRGTVSIAYGKVGKKLVKIYGDDAAKFLFKYGDNAMYALTDGGEAVLKIVNKGNEKAIKVIFDNGEDAIKLLSKNLDNLDGVAEIIAKKGKAGIKLLRNAEDFVPEIARNFAKYGDEYFVIINQLGSRNLKTFLRVTSEYSDDAIKSILLTQKQDPKQLTKAIKYIEAYGNSGINKIKKWNGIIPEEITFNVIRIEKKRVLSSIKAITDEMLLKPGIKLTEKQFDDIMANPRLLRKLVYDTTGKRFDEGFQEFFIRLSKESPEQMKKLWGSRSVKNFIKNTGIRSGGVHEWLMCSNFLDFLVNPKWENDGPYLVNAMTSLVQNTQNVRFKNGGAHGADWSVTFHNILFQRINMCESSSEIYEKIRIFAFEVLTQDSYDEFLEILNKVLNT